MNKEFDTIVQHVIWWLHCWVNRVNRPFITSLVRSFIHSIVRLFKQSSIRSLNFMFITRTIVWSCSVSTRTDIYVTLRHYLNPCSQHGNCTSVQMTTSGKDPVTFDTIKCICSAGKTQPQEYLIYLTYYLGQNKSPPCFLILWPENSKKHIKIGDH